MFTVFTVFAVVSLDNLSSLGSVSGHSASLQTIKLTKRYTTIEQTAERKRRAAAMTSPRTCFQKQQMAHHTNFYKVG